MSYLAKIDNNFIYCFIEKENPSIVQKFLIQQFQNLNRSLRGHALIRQTIL